MMNALKTLFNTAKLYSYWAWLELAGLGSFYRKYGHPSGDKNVALLSFCLPPQFNSGTHRPLSFIKYAHENDWQLIALTNAATSPLTAAGEQLAKEIPNNVPIHHFDNLIGDTSWLLTPKLDGDFASAISLTLAAIKHFKTNRPSVILASAPPFCYAVAGLWLARMFNVPLVLDYRDEWTLCPFNFVSKTGFDRWFEARCVKRADTILYTTESHRIAHQKHFGIAQDKQKLTFNGWEENNENITTAINADTTKTIKLSYIGRLSGHVDLAPFINTLNQAIINSPALENCIQLEFIGEKSEELNKQLKQFMDSGKLHFTLVSTPQVSKSEALTRMQHSDYLLMLCNKELATYIPGKLYDYLSRKVPVIAYGYTGEVSEILTQLEAGFFIEDHDVKRLSDALLGDPIDLTHNSKLQAWLQHRTRRSQAKSMFAQLHKLTR